MARELQDINSSGELTEIKLTAAQEANKLLQKQEIDAALATKEDKLSNPIVDGEVLSATTTGTKSWVKKIGDAPADNKEYVRKNSGWEENTGGAGVPEAPIDGDQYARKDADWSKIVAPQTDTNWGDIQGSIGNQADLVAELNAKEPVGSAAVVQGNLDTHEADVTNPHQVTALQTGAVEEIYAGTGITINHSVPGSPVVSATGSTTAGTIRTVYFTGDTIILSSGTYYRSNGEGKGAIAEVEQVVNVNDDQKAYFAQDIIGIQDAKDITIPVGDYTAVINTKADNDRTYNRFTIELYVTDADGVPVDSPDITSPIGDLGVRVLAILDSGNISLIDSTLHSIPLSGNISNEVVIIAGQRIRYHVSAAKVGTAGVALNISLYYGSDYNTYIEAPILVTTSNTINESNIAGATATDALNAIDTLVASKPDISYEDEIAGGMKLARVAALPGTPDANTIYFVTT